MITALKDYVNFTRADRHQLITAAREAGAECRVRDRRDPADELHADHRRRDRAGALDGTDAAVSGCRGTFPGERDRCDAHAAGRV